MGLKEVIALPIRYPGPLSATERLAHLRAWSRPKASPSLRAHGLKALMTSSVATSRSIAGRLWRARPILSVTSIPRPLASGQPANHFGGGDRDLDHPPDPRQSRPAGLRWPRGGPTSQAPHRSRPSPQRRVPGLASQAASREHPRHNPWRLRAGAEGYEPPPGLASNRDPAGCPPPGPPGQP